MVLYLMFGEREINMRVSVTESSLEERLEEMSTKLSWLERKVDQLSKGWTESSRNISNYTDCHSDGRGHCK